MSLESRPTYLLSSMRGLQTRDLFKQYSLHFSPFSFLSSVALETVSENLKSFISPPSVIVITLELCLGIVTLILCKSTFFL